MVDVWAVMVALGAATACWLISLHRMRGMDMEVNAVGSINFFLIARAWLIAATMLPGALPAVLRNARERRRIVRRRCSLTGRSC